MCRMLAVRSVAARPIASLVLDGSHSLLSLSREHAHGWGIARFQGGQLIIDKGTGPAHADPEFSRTARQVVSDCAVAHVRRISVGEQRLENTHPFRYQRFLFAHNGTIQRFAENRAAILQDIAPDLRNRIQGGTDSEHAFYLFLTKLGDGSTLEDMAKAVAATVRRILELPTEPGKEHILNFLVSDGDRLVGCAAGKELSFLAEPPDIEGPAVERLVVASEPTGGGPWHALSWGQMVGIDSSMVVRRWTIDESLPRRSSA